MTGKIDEVAVYDRALDLDEIKSDMENGVYFAVDPKGKIATTWAHLKKQVFSYWLDCGEDSYDKGSPPQFSYNPSLSKFWTM